MYVTKRSPKLKGSKKSAAAKALNPVLESLENRTLLSNSQLFADPSLVAIPDASASSIAGYTPAQIKTAYGFNGVSGTGAGQVIAIVDAYNDPNISSDLSAFDSQYGLGPASLSVVNQNGSASKSALPATNAGWDLEISLDVEWAHAIAPGASILLVEANSSSLSNLLAAENYARGAKGVTVVSMSWGSSEFQGETADDAYFTTTPGHKGVTFVAASGDEGSWYGPDWPASSPDVLSVGGTTLYLANSSGTYGGETGWSDSTGGISSYEPEPAYQTIAQDTGYETSPDVAYDADPNTGIAVYDTVAYEGGKGWWEMGGTSAGAPQWAGIIAIADQGRAADGLQTLYGGTQTLPLLFSLYNSSQYYDAFHDETVGSSSWYYSAGPGYDAVTGLGSPQAAYIIQELIGASATGTQTAVTVRAKVAATARRAVEIPTTNQMPPAPVAAVTAAESTAIEKPSSIIPTSPVITNSTAIAPASASETSHGLATTASISDPIVIATPSNIHHASNNLLDDISIAVADFGIDRDVAAAKAISAIGGASTDIVERLLTSNASAFAPIANTVAARLHDEDVVWKDTTALVIAGVIIGSHLMRDRRAARPGEAAA